MDPRETILTAAASCFAEEGYGAASMSAITEEAGVSKASVFRYFETKENLYKEVIMEYFGAVTGIWDSSDSPNSLRSLNQLMLNNLKFQTASATPLRLLIWDLLGNSEKQPKLTSDLLIKYFERLSEAIKKIPIDLDKISNKKPQEIAYSITAYSLCYLLMQDGLKESPAYKFMESEESYIQWLAEQIL